MGLAARGDHLGGPRRPPQRRRRGVRRLRHGDQAPAARHLGRGADPRLQGIRARAPDRDGRPARHPQSQPRDRRAAVPAGPSRRPLRPRARAAGQRPAHGPRRAHQERASSSAWARSGTRCSCACAICAAATSTSSRSASTCGPRTATCRWPGTTRPDEFAELRDLGLAMGFYARAVEPAHPLVLPRVGAGCDAADGDAADGRHRRTQALGPPPRARPGPGRRVSRAGSGR